MCAYVTHTARKTKGTQIFETTGNLRAVQPLTLRMKPDGSVRYVGIVIENSLAIEEATQNAPSCVAASVALSCLAAVNGGAILGHSSGGIVLSRAA